MQAEMIEKLVLEAVERVLGCVPDSLDDNLLVFVEEHGRSLADFIYIFDILEKVMGLPVAKVVAKRNYSALTVRGLARAVREDFGKIQVM